MSEMKTCARCKHEAEAASFLNDKGEEKKICRACQDKAAAGRAKKSPATEDKPGYGEREERVPLANKRVMDFDVDMPGYEVYSPVDKPGRIEELEKAGWEICNRDGTLADPGADRASQLGSAVTTPGGNGRTHYLMRKRKDWYDEDRKIYDERAKAIEESIVNADDKQASFYQKSSNPTKVKTGLHNKQS